METSNKHVVTRDEVSDQDFVMHLFDEGVMPQNQGGDAAVPDVAFFDAVVYDA